ncbi:hypothetical protein EJ02DRAFT_514191 [Clathrospora elynae]|uniref:Uncharacterized protein n=1 Tax=Clathrospora elynae TaxID=706981 RepID=A0A6A5SGZ3_9PLEO|nr:hypothetical protein EJ02DRAFT_514191 [Clathrospora elynae]
MTTTTEIAPPSPSSTTTFLSSIINFSPYTNSTLSIEQSSSSPNSYESITAPIVSTILSARSISSTSSSPSSASLISFPEDQGKHIDQVANRVRLDYDTQLFTEDRCSLPNAQTEQDIRQGASFQPYTNGQRGGTCTLSGSDPGYVDSPGCVSVVHTGTYSSGEECAHLNATSSDGSVDTSALFASMTSIGVSVSTPDSGIIPPVSSGSVTPSSSETVLTPSSTGGTGDTTLSGGTTVTYATSDYGVIPPAATSLPSISPTPTLDYNVTISVGTVMFTITSGAITKTENGQLVMRLISLARNCPKAGQMSVARNFLEADQGHQAIKDDAIAANGVEVSHPIQKTTTAEPSHTVYPGSPKESVRGKGAEVGVNPRVKHRAAEINALRNWNSRSLEREHDRESRNRSRGRAARGRDRGPSKSSHVEKRT